MRSLARSRRRSNSGDWVGVGTARAWTGLLLDVKAAPRSRAPSQGLTVSATDASTGTAANAFSGEPSTSLSEYVR